MVKTIKAYVIKHMPFLNPQKVSLKRVFKSVFHYMSHELPTLVFDSPDTALVDEI